MKAAGVVDRYPNEVGQVHGFYFEIGGEIVQANGVEQAGVNGPGSVPRRGSRPAPQVIGCRPCSPSRDCDRRLHVVGHWLAAGGEFAVASSEKAVLSREYIRPKRRRELLFKGNGAGQGARTIKSPASNIWSSLERGTQPAAK